VIQVRKDYRERQDPRVHKESKESKESREFKELLVQPDHRVCREFKD
jgi:hypothetical protein